MKLLLARLLAGGTAVGTAAPVLTGGMDDADFVVPDLILAVALIGAALLPARIAPLALIPPAAFALGVFSVAAARQMGEGALSPMLGVAILTSAACLALALWTRRSPAVS
ncbi:hypothetical protein [Brevundimonas sp.]|jgi:hypothetical protein|uniref:hypothetical protein n=1 Tax=Brevundimonas sp. TaxID=1871086 RepID=UPI002E11D429|nr:hypothetical protein [Brevundimonas sp.]